MDSISRVRVAALAASRAAIVATALAAGSWSSPVEGAAGLVLLPGATGCVRQSGPGCTPAGVFATPRGIVVSPDGQSLYVAVQTSDALVAFDRDPSTGAVTRLAGTAGCVAAVGSAECAAGFAMDGAFGVAISPDGRNVYLVSSIGDAIAIFDRDPSTGAISQKFGTAGCISETGTGVVCTDGKALENPLGVAVSQDGRNVYVLSSGTGDSVAVFDRSLTTGALTQKAGLAGCISQTGTGGLCVDGLGLDGANTAAVSPDGRNVYVSASGSDVVAVFDRDPATGALTQKAGMAGCVSETGSSGSCIDGKGLDGPVGVVVSSDGRQVYVASQNSSAVAILDRDLATGALTPKNATAGCTSDTGTGGECVDGRALGQPRAVLISPDGESVYVVAQAQGSLATFDRDPLSGELVQKSLAAGCFGIAGNTDGCPVNNFLALATGGAASPDGRSVYVSAITSDVMLVFARDLPVLDVDGDGVVSPLTDGLLLLRYSFGFTGSTLITGAVDQAACTRCTAEQIEAFIQGAIDDV